MDMWSSKTDEIHSAFFRSGPYTHLWIDPDVSDGTLKWRYQFMDLGMCHVIEEACSVAAIHQHPSEEERLAFVFGRRYCRCIAELYARFLRDEAVDCIVHEPSV